jgi:hypothetical protein
MGRISKIDVAIGGYIRLRKRRLCSASATASTSYELVRLAPTVDKPWHKRISSLGSLKEPVQDENDLIRFWQTALFRMRRHGLDAHQCRHAASEMMAQRRASADRPGDPFVSINSLVAAPAPSNAVQVTTTAVRACGLNLLTSRPILRAWQRNRNHRTPLAGISTAPPPRASCSAPSTPPTQMRRLRRQRSENWNG